MMRTAIFFLLTIFFSACARTFHPIDPSSVDFTNTKYLTDDVYISYRYDVQDLNENKPYARKERKKNIRLIAVEIRNNSASDFSVRRENLSILSLSGDQIQILETQEYTKAIRQYSETFAIFYGLAGFGAAWGSDDNGDGFFNLTYNPIPLAIGIGNAIFAESSNSKQKRNLADFEIFDRTVKPGEKLRGLLPLKVDEHVELIFKYSDDTE